ncbi:PBECR4 domain-containing protein [Pseudobutyrivibrio sp.]|uniref:PBECR4 domain-containing protein n=1 Tax=Pseudobutyrivibrio sp. TaxID=2014367 RepID=UPI0025F1A013|nr:PBECR4 domain-containing protein [Pseudobutyrivibrio sp.]
MDKKKVISIITRAAKLYHENLEDQKVLFVYGTPSEIKPQIDNGKETIEGLDLYEVVFYRSNFLHLTGLKLNRRKITSAINFYSKCLDGRLSEDDFIMAKDGSSVQKLEVLENMMNIKKTASMIGDFSDFGLKLYSEKIAGNTFACMGFVEDSYTNLNVPNTLLKKDIRDVSSKPQKKIYAILSKAFAEEKYTIIEKCDSSLVLSKIVALKDYM